MRAALLRRCGTAPEVGDRAVPVPADGQILVRVTAASITPLDPLCASGTGSLAPHGRRVVVVP
jgi:NADPH2:quinone reductase